MRGRIYSMVVLAGLTTPTIVSGQTTPAQRAQQLAKIEEDLNSGDPNLRLATMEAAMESNSIAIRTRAMSIAMASSDVGLNAIGLRHKICATSQISVRHGYSVAGHNAFLGFKSGQMIFDVKSCDVNAGAAVVEFLNVYEGRRQLGRLQIRSRSMSISFTAGDSACSIDMTLEQQQQMRGRLSCAAYNAFGPVEAIYNLD